jgi:hypothetical protein
MSSPTGLSSASRTLTADCVRLGLLLMFDEGVRGGSLERFVCGVDFGDEFALTVDSSVLLSEVRFLGFDGVPFFFVDPK